MSSGRPADLKVRVPDLRRLLAERTLERDAAHSREAATADILRIIRDSPGDLTSVFDAILDHALQLCEAAFGFMMIYDGQRFTPAAQRGVPEALAAYFATGMHQPQPGDAHWRLMSGDNLVHSLDQKNEAYRLGNPLRRAVVDLGRARSALVVALRAENVLLGALTIYRKEVRSFSDQQITLLQHFAAQAVIAIENTRLLSDLREALQQQTATADVLKVISRSLVDLETVLETLVETAARLCRADQVYMFHLRHDLWHLVAAWGLSAEAREFFLRNPFTPGRGSTSGRAALERQAVLIPDVLQDPEYALSEGQKIAGYRTTLGIPLLREDTLIGVFSITRTRVEAFTEKEIEIATTFADQAVIAIENARLLSDLREALEQQTATADVLKVISRSTFDLQTVLEALTITAARLSVSDMAYIAKQGPQGFHPVTAYNFPPEWRDVPKPEVRRSRGSVMGRALLEEKAVQIPDVLADADYEHPELQKAAGFRTVLAAPLMRQNQPIGVLFLGRRSVSAYTQQQIDLVTTFADQAVIAIENVRLFDEVTARTEELRESLQQQTATADVLKVISRSTFDLPAVLHALVESEVRLCQADKGTITRQIGGAFYRAESYGFSKEFMDYVRTVPIQPERSSASGRALLEGRVIHIRDVEVDPDYDFAQAQRLGVFRTILAVPMLREGVPIGVITLTRDEAKPFTDKQIELAVTFADQASIAIENVRLFEAVKARTDELALSLDELRAAQQRLIQTEKLASLGQLTAGIAHEIKNPLNFVNNFASVSQELAAELGEAVGKILLDDSVRSELHQSIKALNGNLEKIVQHGRRADSIVKNMLLHSRHGTGDHRLTSINAIVEETLNLAYHGARAERPDFEVTLEKELDPTAGDVEMYPQEVTRVLLNIISNGFYASAKRKSEIDDPSFMPLLVMKTRNLGSSVEIRVRDNGVGLTDDVREKMFNPFFTTKPAGEGTGLGLSISHDIIVKQHGGQLDVSSVPGSYTELAITLPRFSPQLPAREARH